MSPLREQLLKTANTYVEAHKNIDVEALRAIYSPLCVHRCDPKPVHPIFPVVNNAEYMTAIADVFKIWHRFECRQFAEAVVDEEARKVVLYIEGRGEADAGTYENEYIVTLKMSEDGTLIEERLQFFDSQPVLEWVTRLGKIAQDLQAKVKNAKVSEISA